MFCVNARMRSNGDRVGILAERDDVLYLSVRFPDLDEFRVCKYCPVWVGAMVEPWREWSHLKSFQMHFAPFFCPPRPRMNARIRLSVALFSERYFRVFALTEYLWGIGPIKVSDVDALAREIYEKQWMQDVDDIARTGQVRRQVDAPRRNTTGDYGYHVDRIAQLVAYGWSDPVQVVSNAALRYAIDDGTHRFAAAILRGDAAIGALTSKEVAAELADQGLTV